MSVVDTLKALKGRELSEQEYFKSAILGWCIELVGRFDDFRLQPSVRLCVDEVCPQMQAYFLVADDIMDQSVTRRGQPCWYRVVSRASSYLGRDLLGLTATGPNAPQEGVGNIAINDAYMLESGIYYLLKNHFRSEPYYMFVMELFHEVSPAQ